MGGKPPREGAWKEEGRDYCKCQQITPSSSVNPGTLCGNGRCRLTGSSQPPAPVYLPLQLSLGISSVLPDLKPPPSPTLVTADQVPCLSPDPPVSDLSLSTAASSSFRQDGPAEPFPVCACHLLMPALHSEALWHALKCLTHSSGVSRFP